MKKRKLKFGGRADAYLEWAFHTRFQGYCTVLERERNKQIGLLVQWPDDPADLSPASAPEPVKIPSVYQGFRHTAMAVDLYWLLTNPEALSFLGRARRIELTSPMAASYDVDTPSLLGQGYPGVDAPEGVLLGCIDDMFPLANAAFFRGGANRIARFWDQNDAGASAGKRLGTRSDDPHGTDFGYGKELVRNAHHAAAIATATDLQDESAYYERMGMSALRRNATHGAHVLDLFAGPLPARSRISVSRDLDGGGDGSSCSPPSRQVADDPASRAPIVLVELPDYAIEDPSGRWLGRNILDGLHYIDQVAGPVGNGIQRVVVNVSWGPQTGPRDGTSLLEQAMDELVLRPGRQFDIVLAAGNSRTARAHAEFKANQERVGLVWCVPPALEAPSHLEIWWPGGVMPGDAKITVTSPGGTMVETAGGEGIWTPQGRPNPLWGVTQVRCGDRMMALVALAPTFVRDCATDCAQHGRWLISIKRIETDRLVHVNVARTNHNMGAKRPSPGSYLWDPSYETFRSGRQGRSEAPPPHCQVQPAGTLSGIATGSFTRVASGYRLADALPSTYASQGPCDTRVGPDFCYPTDESSVLLGIRGGGVRSGSVTRIIGTSAASPQLARDSSNLGAIPQPVGRTDPRLGMGLR